MIVLPVEELDRAAFMPFGEVIAADDTAQHYPINEGSTERYHDLAAVDVAEQGGRALINIFRARPRTLPFEVRMLECHPLGSQAFVPLSRLPYLVVVAPAGQANPTELRAFIVRDGVGVNYARGVWHHPLLALQAESDFLVIDRGGRGRNLEEVLLATPRLLQLNDAAVPAPRG